MSLLVDGGGAKFLDKVDPPPPSGIWYFGPPGGDVEEFFDVDSPLGNDAAKESLVEVDHPPKFMDNDDDDDSLIGDDKFMDDDSMGRGFGCSYHFEVCKVHQRLIDIKKLNLPRKKMASMGVSCLHLPPIRSDFNEKRYICRHRPCPQVDNLKGKKGYEGTLSDFLGDYLINKMKYKIDTKRLEGKYLVLLIAQDPESLYDPEFLKYLPEVELTKFYDQLKERNTEVVFVPSNAFAKRFMSFLSHMPWLAVPFTKHHRRIRKNLLRKFGKRWIILDPSGEVLQTEGDYIFHFYGPESFPYTDARIQEIDSQDAGLLEADNFDLQALLGSSKRDVLLESLGNGSTDFRSVQISKLKDKLIGLLFIDICYLCYTHEITNKLLEAYNKLKGTTMDKYDFQIVLVHLPLDCPCRKRGEELFKLKFANMPWYALPFEDPTCRKLWRIFGLLDKYDVETDRVTFDKVLVIIGGPNGKCVERHLGAYNMVAYGPDGYPFTQERAVEITKSKLKNLTLNLFFSRPGCVLSSKHRKVCVSELLGKKVIVIFAAYYCFKYSAFLRELKKLYARNKGTPDEFEVIHIALECSQSSYDKCAAKMPWLMYPYNIADLYSLARRIFADLHHDLPGLAAFGQDGKFQTKQNFLMDHVMMNQDVFPFIKGNDLHYQVIKDFPDKCHYSCYSRSTCC